MPHARRARHRIPPAPRRRVVGRSMVPRAPAALLQATERLAEAAATGALARPGIVTAAAGPVVVGRALVVAEPEEPHEPDHEQADIEDAEANHEDPALSGHHRGS